jgi:chromosome transmission fidelity protein 1
MPSYLSTESLDKTHEQIKHLSLGSRKNLCINLKVTRLGSLPAINEKCQDMQQTGWLIQIEIFSNTTNS